ncbi:MAG: phospholipase D-like domain-containing protein [Rhizobiaceae bacterium]|nr:phospholipase D-like domain-containing protein [Rhizobiaceae bacterium]
MTFGIVIILHILVASAVTGHVLLKKSNVRAAIGWIGLVWFSPYFGAIIYAVFGINRIARRASRIRRNPEPNPDVVKFFRLEANELDEEVRTLAGVGTQATGLPLTHGNSISMLRSGDQAYPEMLEAIANANTSIALATYIFRRDSVGRAFVDALIAAKARGVEVRVLVDGIGSGYFFSPVVRHLRGAGVPVIKFMHDWRPWRMSFINLRNHKKLLVVDGVTGFAGGLNFGVENTRIWSRKRAVMDAHFRLVGPVVSQLMISFAEDWLFATGEALEGSVWWPEIKQSGTVVARGVSSGPDEDAGSIETILAAALSQAKHQIRIVTPYFLPDEQLQFAIVQAGLRGVQIDLVIPERSDHVLLDWAMGAHLGFFPMDCMSCYKTPKPFDHSKLVTVDEKWCAVGSPNWDVRSLRLNFEFLVECYDEATVKTINALIQEKIERGHLLKTDDLAFRPLVLRLRDACARLLLPYL